MATPEEKMEQRVSLTCTPREAARRLGIGRNLVYELLHSNQLPAFRVGRTFRVPVAALEQWLEQAVLFPRQD